MMRRRLSWQQSSMARLSASQLSGRPQAEEIFLMDTLIMSPEKSVTAFIGIEQ